MMKVDKMIAFIRIYCKKADTEARQKSEVIIRKGFAAIFYLRKYYKLSNLRKIKFKILLGGEGPDGKVLEDVDLPFTRLNQELLEGFEQRGLKINQFSGVESFYDWQKSSQKPRVLREKIEGGLFPGIGKVMRVLLPQLFKLFLA